MLKDKGGILYHGDFKGKVLHSVGAFKNEKELNKLIEDYTENKNCYYTRWILWNEAKEKDEDVFVDITIDYGSYSDFLLIVYNEEMESE